MGWGRNARCRVIETHAKECFGSTHLPQANFFAAPHQNADPNSIPRDCRAVSRYPKTSAHARLCAHHSNSKECRTFEISTRNCGGTGMDLTESADVGRELCVDASWRKRLPRSKRSLGSGSIEGVRSLRLCISAR